MARSIIAVIASYIVMFILTFILFSGMYLVLGADGAFKPGNYEASTVWLGLSFLLFLIVGILAGLLCAVIAKGGRAYLALAVVVLAVGLLLAIPSLIAKKAGTNLVRTGSVSNFEAMSRAQEPVWAPFLFPIIGAAGVMIGGKLKRQS